MWPSWASSLVGALLALALTGCADDPEFAPEVRIETPWKVCWTTWVLDAGGWRIDDGTPADAAWDLELMAGNVGIGTEIPVEGAMDLHYRWANGTFHLHSTSDFPILGFPAGPLFVDVDPLWVMYTPWEIPPHAELTYHAEANFTRYGGESAPFEGPVTVSNNYYNWSADGTPLGTLRLVSTPEEPTFFRMGYEC